MSPIRQVRQTSSGRGEHAPKIPRYRALNYVASSLAFSAWAGAILIVFGGFVGIAKDVGTSPYSSGYAPFASVLLAILVIAVACMFWTYMMMFAELIRVALSVEAHTRIIDSRIESIECREARTEALLIETFGSGYLKP